MAGAKCAFNKVNAASSLWVNDASLSCRQRQHSSKNHILALLTGTEHNSTSRRGKINCVSRSRGVLLSSDSKRVSNWRQQDRRVVRVQAAKRKAPESDGNKEEEWDPDFVAAINEICNKAVRVMLSEDIQQVNALRVELDSTGATLVEHGEIDAARFMLVVQEMLEHKLAPESTQLRGRFLKAFEKIFSLIEDAGWNLEAPDENGEAGAVVDSDAVLEQDEDQPAERVVEPYNRTFQAHDQFV